MSDDSVAKSFKKELFDIFEETFENVHGIFLDRGTSLFETLETISAEEASRPVSEKCACIAAQVEHTRFYLRVLENCFYKRTIGKVDWSESWQLKGVTPEEWEALKKSLKEAVQDVSADMKNIEDWEGEDNIGASLAILVHTAYHLGEIRQALGVIRPS